MSSHPPPAPEAPRRAGNRRRRRIILAALAVVALALAAVPLVAMARAWNAAERFTIERDPPAESRDEVEEVGSPTGEGGGTEEEPDREPGEIPSVVLLVGSDSRADVDGLPHFGSFEGKRADVIVLAFVDEEEITLLSVPRDLWVQDTCDDQGSHKVAEAFEGCDGRSGMAQLVSELEAVFEVTVDHAAAVDMAEFPDIVDAIGGYEICTEHPLRDRESGLELPAGCTEADGDTTLAWLRSRHTQRQVDGRWEVVPAISDLVRNERQRQFLIDVFDRIRSLSDVTEVIGVARELAPGITIDDQLSLTDAARWAWQLRSTPLSTADLSVVDEVTPWGEEILVSTEPLPEVAERLRGNESQGATNP